MKITASTLKSKYETANPSGKFFTRENMKFAGDKMSNYYVPAKTVQVRRSSGEIVECFELQRRKAVKGGLSSSAYFSVETFGLIHGEPVEAE